MGEGRENRKHEKCAKLLKICIRSQIFSLASLATAFLWQDSSEILNFNFFIFRKLTQVFDFELAAGLSMMTANDDCK
jgi:hypothetical protein